MSDSVTDINSNDHNTDERRRFSPLFLFGGVLWLLAFTGIVFGWYQWRQQHLALIAASKSDSKTTDDGRNPKTMKLIPQKDGTYVAQEMSPGEADNPWDAEGIDDFSFTDCHGQSITKQDLLGKPFIIAFVFTHCRGPCPNVTLQMRELQDRLKDFDFNLVTLTVDPERDTIETLQQYGTDQGANFERWKFLTGNQTEIYGLIQRSFKMPVEEVQGPGRVPGFEIIHSTNIMLVDETGRVIGKFNAQKVDEMARLRKELKRLAKPVASNGDIRDKDGTH